MVACVSLMVACVQVATCIANRVPTKGGYMGISFFEAFEGRKLYYNRDFRAAFGDIIVTKDPNVLSNSNSPRAEVCVMANPANDDQGSVWAIKLSNFKKVLRHQFEIIPTTLSHIDHLNLYAEHCKSKDTSDPVFVQGETVIQSIVGDEDLDVIDPTF